MAQPYLIYLRVISLGVLPLRCPERISMSAFARVYVAGCVGLRQARRGETS